MPPTYKPRTQSVDVGRYRLEFTVATNGTVSFTAVRVSGEDGVETVLTGVLRGEPDAEGTLAIVADAYDATNHVAVARGGGTPRAARPAAEPKPRDSWWQDGGGGAYAHALAGKPKDTAENIYRARCHALVAPVHRVHTADGTHLFCPECAQRVPLPGAPAEPEGAPV